MSAAEQFSVAPMPGGDVCYRIFDASGVPVRSELDERVIGIEPNQLMMFPRRIGIAAGVRKIAALRGALLGGWVNVLITDTTAAQLLIEKPATAPERTEAFAVQH